MNPLEYLEKVHGITTPHITYDPNIEKEYEIIRGSSHDGTLLFTYQNIDRCLEPLVNKTSCYKLTAPENPDDVIDIKYTVGDIRFENEFGMIDVPAGRIQGQKETVIVPVRCEYVMKEKAKKDE